MKRFAKRFVATLLPLALALAAPAVAQPLTPVGDLPTVASGKLGQPANPVTVDLAPVGRPPANPPGTTVNFFDARFAKALSRSIDRMREALRECDWENYYRAFLATAVNWSIVRDVIDGKDPAAGRDDITRGRARADELELLRLFAQSLLPQYSEYCPPDVSANIGLPTLESGKLGLPEQPLPGSLVPVYDAAFARGLADGLDGLARAIKECDEAAWRRHYEAVWDLLRARANQSYPGDGRTEIDRGRAVADIEIVRRLLMSDWKRYPRPCTKQQ